MSRSSKKAESSGMYEAQVGDVLTKLRAWERADTELHVMLNHAAASLSIRCRVHELREGTFTFYEPGVKLSVLVFIKSFSHMMMSANDPGACIHLATRSGEGLTIFENTSLREDLFEQFPEPSSTVQ